MIKHVTGDLLQADVPAIAHGCNCQGMMGSGIAKPVREKFGEEMFDRYHSLCVDGLFVLGDTMPWWGEDQILFNLATQNQPGPDARLWAIYESVKEMCRMADGRDIDTIGVPRIGAGIGGLKWEHVEGVLIAASERAYVTLEVYTLP